MRVVDVVGGSLSYFNAEYVDWVDTLLGKFEDAGFNFYSNEFSIRHSDYENAVLWFNGYLRIHPDMESLHRVWITIRSYKSGFNRIDVSYEILQDSPLYYAIRAVSDISMNIMWVIDSKRAIDNLMEDVNIISTIGEALIDV